MFALKASVGMSASGCRFGSARPSGAEPVPFTRRAVLSRELDLQRSSVRSLAAAEPPLTYTPAPPGPGGLLELTKDNYYEYLEEHKDRLVVVDCFTDWCGPCKLIYPELCKMAEEMPEIRFVKFNCNKYNKELGVQLKIRVAPTFLLYVDGKKFDEMTGAKLEKLREKIDDALNQQTFITSSAEES